MKDEYPIDTIKHESAILLALCEATKGLDKASAQSRRLKHMDLDGIDNIYISPTNEDVIIIERFNTYVSIVNQTKDNRRGTIFQYSYYKMYLHQPINCLWNLITKSDIISKETYRNRFQSISTIGGMQLLGLKRDVRKKGLRTQIKTVKMLYHLLSGYCTYLSTNSTAVFNTATSIIHYIYSNNLDTAVGKNMAAWIRSNVPNPNKISYNKYKKGMFPKVPLDSGNPQPDASAVERSLHSMIRDGYNCKEFNDRQLCTTFEELVTVLQDVHELRLNSDNQAEMTRDGWTTFLNSMLVSSMWFVTLKSKFHPSCGERSIPLDVLAGITRAEDYECIGTGPMLDLHLEKHPTKQHQHLCVTVLQNHLSKSYVDSIRDRVNESNFYLKNQKFVRVATQQEEEGTYPFFGMEFGSDDSTYDILQAELANNVDDEAMKMANYILSAQDEVFKNACDILQQTVLSILENTTTPVAVTNKTKAKRGVKRPLSNYTAKGDSKKKVASKKKEDNKKLINYQSLNRLDERSKKNLNKKLKSCGPRWAAFSTGSDVFAYPISTNDIPLDKVDSVHTNISPGSSYTMHSDTCNKVGNHNDHFYHSHSLAMRIWTQGFQFSALSSTEGDETTTLPSDNVSLIHGIPDGNNGVNYCELHVRFSNGPGNNISAVTLPPKRGRILMGHATHAHLQPTGSQGDLQHSIKNDKKNNICRMIHSSRSFHPHTSRLYNKFLDNTKCLTGKSNQKYSNVIDHVSNSGRLKEVVTAELHLKRRRRDRKDAKKPPRFWEPNLMTNGTCVPSDAIHRRDILGVKRSKEYQRLVALNWTLIPRLYRAGVTLLVTHREGYGKGAKKIASTCGPHITPSHNEGEFYLTRPWHNPISNISAKEGVPANKHVKFIIGEKRDTMVVTRLSKCHSTLGIAIKTVMTGEGVLGEIIVRGSGGASYSAGNVAPSAIGMDTTDPTFVLATPQRFYSYDHIALQQSIREGRTFNVFYGERLIGLFRVKEIRNAILSREDFDKERNKFSAILEELHALDPTNFPHKTPTDQMNNELNSMMTCGNWYYLKPVLPKLHQQFSSEVKNIPWKMIEVNADIHFDVPQYACDKKNLQKLKHDHFTSLEQMLEFTMVYDYKRFFSPVGYEVIRKYLGEEEVDDTLNKVSESIPNSILRMLFQPPESTTHKLTLDVAIGAAVHSGGLTTLKATSPELVHLVNHGSELSTASTILSNLTGIPHQDLNEYHNLKNVMAKPVHPPMLGLEMPIGICMLATGSLDKSLREVNEGNKQWKHRVGGEFFVSQEGWDIAFRVICIIITSTGNFLDALYELDGRSFRPDGSIETPLPASKQLDAYLGFVDLHDWSSTVVHKNFRGAIRTKNDYISFINNLSKSGAQAFQRAMKDTSTSSFISKDRSKILNNLKTEFSNMGATFTAFQVNVIMRAIECCMHEPFGIVKEHVRGPGSREIARLLTRDFEGDKHVSNEQKLLKYMNDRARTSVNKGQMRDELIVLGLEWSEPLDCLVHRSGIGKKFDVNDIEHLECMLYKMYFNTAPSMNVGITFRYANEKFYPIKLKGKIFAEQRFVKKLFPDKDDVIEAYVRLLCDKTYEHKAVGEIFRIDHNEKETDIVNVDIANVDDLDDYVDLLPHLNWQKARQVLSNEH